MNPKDTPESKTQKTNINSNKKKTDKIQGSIKKIEPSALKKNEFALILFGALVLTIIVFFFFFRSSDTKTESIETSTSITSFADFEKRIERLEQALETRENSSGSADSKITKGMADIEPLKKRVTRLESAFSFKFDSLTERMNDIEKSVSGLKDKPVTAVAPKSIAKPAALVKKEKKASVSHIIQKGETLYKISKKYNTSVSALRKLNNLSIDAKIYPGSIIIIQ